MYQQRSLSLLSSAERHLLRQQWRQSGQCYRCFHASRSRMADEESKKPEEKTANDKGTPYNKPSRAPSRQQRAAMISNEVSALAADLPTDNIRGRNAEVDGAQDRSPGVDPRSEGRDLRPGAMGANDSPAREGPFAQGIARETREENEDQLREEKETKQVRMTRTPAQGMEDLGKGGENVMEATSTPSESNQPPSSQTPTIATSAPSSTLSPAKTTSQTPSTYLELGLNASTPLSNNFTGLLADRANLLASPGSHKPSPRETRHRLRRSGNKLTAFHSPEEKATTLRERTDLEARLKELKKEKATLLEKGTAESDPPSSLLKSLTAIQSSLSAYPAFVPLPQRERQKIVDRFVLGKYDPQGLLSGKQVHRQAVLNDVAKGMLRNGTYLARDGERFLAKVRSLVPAAVATAPAAAGGKGRQAKQAPAKQPVKK